MFRFVYGESFIFQTWILCWTEKKSCWILWNHWLTDDPFSYMLSNPLPIYLIFMSQRLKRKNSYYYPSKSIPLLNERNKTAPLRTDDTPFFYFYLWRNWQITCWYRQSTEHWSSSSAPTCNFFSPCFSNIHLSWSNYLFFNRDSESPLNFEETLDFSPKISFL